MSCPVPSCPYEKERRWREHGRDPNCTCGEPLLLYIPPGEHAHPCPVHPDHAVRGPSPMWIASHPEGR